jgi:hypothetical protein
MWSQITVAQQGVRTLESNEYQNADLLIVKACGTYSYRQILKGYN